MLKIHLNIKIIFSEIFIKILYIRYIFNIKNNKYNNVL